MGTLLRFHDPDRGARVGVQIANTIYDVTDKFPSVSGWLRATVGRSQAAIDDIEMVARNAKLAYLASVLDAPAIPQLASLTSPVDLQDVWSAGVTFPNKRAAREQEAKVGGELYTVAFNAQRPMLIFKAQAGHVVGPYGQVGIRKDAANSIAEPELALLLNPALEIVGYTVGMGMFARDIAAENPLYLPQAMQYSHSVALGPGFVLQKLRGQAQVNMRMTVLRDRQTVFEGEVSTSAMRRDLNSTIEYLGRCHTFPDGVVLMMGSGIVLPSEFTIRVGDTIRVSADGVGTLTNQVMLV
jgi:2-dehydro-3-deoxy-D-arabinonate dehydratase